MGDELVETTAGDSRAVDQSTFPGADSAFFHRLRVDDNESAKKL
jgi:hypothetical protein